MSSADCPFCGYAAALTEGDWNRVVAADDDAFILQPNSPVVRGHRLAVPRTHVQDALEDPAVTAATMKLACEEAPYPCNLITSAGSSATQTVMHLHIHIVPRRRGDGLRLPWGGAHGRRVRQGERTP